MNARTLAALALSAAVGVFAYAPTHAQDAMPASAGTAMSPPAMSSKDAMQGAMHKDDMKMKPDAMKPDAMKHGAMKHKAMQHDGMKMKKDDTMKKDAGDAMSNGG